MGIVHNPDSPYGKELEKWEQHRTKYVREYDEHGNPGMPGNPYAYREYPKMLYKAKVHPISGQALCMAPPPDPYAFERPDRYERAVLEAERFTGQCQVIVKNEEEERKLKNDGWRNSPADALARFETQQREIGNAAAERHHADRSMSEKARAEVAAVDASTSEHVPDPSAQDIREAVRESKRGK